MDSQEEKVPKVFISYSHDNPDHKKWVGELASKLVKKGIEVVIDQWNLPLGGDVPKFMEKGVSEADRVLLICTETYVKKADEGQGGVGYEAMIVTGELVCNLGTSKFIPVIRQNNGNELRPISVSTRLYVNLSEDLNFDEQFEVLLRELHQVPAPDKPPLGKNPFAITLAGTAMSLSFFDNNVISSVNDLKDLSSIYKTALVLARNDDIVLWRKIVDQIKRLISEQILEWRKIKDADPPKSKDDLPAIVLEGASHYCPLFVIALAGIESNNERFINQTLLLDDILNPRGWNRAGLVVLGDFPMSVAYIFQALHGGICLKTDQLSLAINLVRTKYDALDRGKKIPLHKNYLVIGWPESLGQDSKNAWKFLMELPDKWPWINEIFGASDEFRAAVSAYYMALHIFELADTIASGNEKILREKEISFDIPLNFLQLDSSIQRQSYRLLIKDAEQVKNIWRNLKVEDTKISEAWPLWIEHTRKKIPGFGFRLYGKIIHEELFEDLS